MVRRCPKSLYEAHDCTAGYKFRCEKRTVAVPSCSGCLRQLKLPSLSDVSCLTELLLTRSHNLHCAHCSVMQLQRHICSLLPAVRADAQRVPIINTHTHCPAHSITDTELSSRDHFKYEDIGASETDQSLTKCN